MTSHCPDLVQALNKVVGVKLVFLWFQSKYAYFHRKYIYNDENGENMYITITVSKYPADTTKQLCVKPSRNQKVKKSYPSQVFIF